MLICESVNGSIVSGSTVCVYKLTSAVELLFVVNLTFFKPWAVSFLLFLIPNQAPQSQAKGTKTYTGLKNLKSRLAKFGFTTLTHVCLQVISRGDQFCRASILW